jgi:hypothetical protein
MTKYDCSKGKHEFEWIIKSCGCEYEVCYRCDHEVAVFDKRMCEMVCSTKE